MLLTDLSLDEIGRVLANRQAARLRHDFKTADGCVTTWVQQAAKVDDKRNRWESSDEPDAEEPFHLRDGGDHPRRT